MKNNIVLVWDRSAPTSNSFS